MDATRERVGAHPVIRLIAQRGGHVNRKHDDPLGPKSLWIGIQRLRDFAVAWMRFNPAGQQMQDV